MRVLSLLKYDLLFQIRHGFYYATFFICFLYVGLLKVIPTEIKTTTTLIIIFSDPLMIGLFFIGAIILLEKEQDTLSTIFVTPLTIKEYFISKIVSLSLLASLLSSLVVFSAFGVVHNFYLLLLGVFGGAAFFTLIGVVIASRVNTLNGYIITSPLYVLIFFLPILKYLGIYDSTLYFLLPSNAVFLMIYSAFGYVSFLEIGLSLFILIGWLVIAYIWADKWFRRYVLLRIGG